MYISSIGERALGQECWLAGSFWFALVDHMPIPEPIFVAKGIGILSRSGSDATLLQVLGGLNL